MSLVAQQGSTGVLEQDEVTQLITSVETTEAAGRGIFLVCGMSCDMVNVNSFSALPFPQDSQGGFSGEPNGSLSAIAQLEVLRVEGADFLLFPPSTRSWQRHFPEFGQHLRRHYRLLSSDSGQGELFALRKPEVRPLQVTLDTLESLIADFQNWFDRYPAILDWTPDLDIAAAFPEHAVFSPVEPDSALPYLDHSIDLVVLSGSDGLRIDDAIRVADVAVVKISGTDTGQDLGGSNSSPESTVVEVLWRTVPRKSSTSSVSIIIPVLESNEHGLTAIRALSDTLPSNFSGEIIVAWDESAACQSGPDLTSGWLSERLRVNKYHADAGLAGLCNRASADTNGDTLIFLAPDSLPLHGWLPFVLSTFRRHPNAGVVGGKLLHPDGSLLEAADVLFPDDLTSKKSEPPEPDDPEFNYVRQMASCSRSFWCTRRSLFSQLGGLRESSSGDEVHDYCARVRACGHAVYYQPKAVLVTSAGPAGKLRFHRKS